MVHPGIAEAEPILNEVEISKMFAGKTLLITDATGSFGNTVLDRFIRSVVKKVVTFSRDEKKLYDMRIALAKDTLAFYIGDTRDAASIRRAMEGMDCVFHAAR